jgi:hypothetical protein
MPKTVATEILCKPGAKLSNRDRKVLMRARETRYEADIDIDQEQRVEHRLAFRMAQKPWATLCRFKKRCTTRRFLVQRMHATLSRRADELGQRTGPPSQSEAMTLLLIDKQLAELALRAARLDLVADAVDAEMRNRKASQASIKKLIDSLFGAPNFARRLKKLLSEQRPSAIVSTDAKADKCRPCVKS